MTTVPKRAIVSAAVRHARYQAAHDRSIITLDRGEAWTPVIWHVISVAVHRAIRDHSLEFDVTLLQRQDADQLLRYLANRPGFRVLINAALRQHGYQLGV